jgi:hypothetical protein
MITPRLFVLLALLAGAFHVACDWTIDRAVHDKRAGAIYDRRRLASAIEKYRIDYGVYPPWSVDGDSVNNHGIPSFDVRVASVFQELDHDKSRTSGFTSGGLFRDPFVKGDVALSYFCDNEIQTWALWSAGPDDLFDFDLATIQKAIRDQDGLLRTLTYDPANGTISGGDIITTKEWYE